MQYCRRQNNYSDRSTKVSGGFQPGLLMVVVKRNSRHRISKQKHEILGYVMYCIFCMRKSTPASLGTL